MRAVCLVFLLVPSLAAQTKIVTVGQPTRLDWAFAVRGFKGEKGQPPGALPKDYDSRKQKYQLFVPANYKPNKAWPLIAFISPGNEPTGFNAFKKVCEKHGVFFCSPYAAGNPVPAGQRTRIILDMLDDVRRQYVIDPDQTYVGGFSGGGRMACSIALSLPEYFAGILPVCGTNPFSPPDYLRHRTEDRLSVAFLTGETDSNRKENEVYMFPYFQELGIRAKLWVTPKLGHAIPGPDVMEQVYVWLKDDLQRRQDDRKARPDLAVKSDEGLAGEPQAQRLLAGAQKELKVRPWHGVTLLQGVVIRWGKTETGKKARTLLTELQKDETLLNAIEEKGSADEIKSLSAQAKGLERFGDLATAIQVWSMLAKSYEGTPTGAAAQTEIRRLQAKK